MTKDTGVSVGVGRTDIVDPSLRTDQLKIDVLLDDEHRDLQSTTLSCRPSDISSIRTASLKHERVGEDQHLLLAAALDQTRASGAQRRAPMHR